MTLAIDPWPIADQEPVEWLVGRLTACSRLRCWMPNQFQSYVRVLHPIWESGDQYLRWSDVAMWAGTELIPSADFVEISRRADGARWGDNHSLPQEGWMEPETIQALGCILAEATSTPEDLWILAWSGYPRVRPPIAVQDDMLVDVDASLSQSGRRYTLQRGTLGMAVPTGWRAPEHDEHPNFWWPNDRSWFVSTDIDSASTYVGADIATAQRILELPTLETVPASLEDEVSSSTAATGS